MEKPIEIQWIIAGIVAGLLSSIFYPILIFVNLPLGLTATLAALLGPAIGVGSLGLRQIIIIHKPSIFANIAAIFCYGANPVGSQRTFRGFSTGTAHTRSLAGFRCCLGYLYRFGYSGFRRRDDFSQAIWMAIFGIGFFNRITGHRTELDSLSNSTC